MKGLKGLLYELQLEGVGAGMEWGVGVGDGGGGGGLKGHTHKIVRILYSNLV